MPSGLIASLGWWCAVVVALIACQGWQWWPDDSWRQAVWPLLIWVVLFGLTADWESANAWRWVLVGLLAIVTGMIAMPSGPGWEDTLPLHQTWLGLVGASCLANVFALDQLSRSGGYRWSLWVALAGLGGSLAFAAATYGSLAQWCLSMIVATTALAAAATFSKCNTGLWTASIPATVGSVGIISASRFFSYDPQPMWVYVSASFLPSLAALIDLPLRQRNPWIRAGVSGLTSLAIVAACVWQALLR